MFFVISKVIAYLLNPLFWILILIVVALFIKRRQVTRRLLIVVIILFYFFSNHFIVDEFIRKWEMPMVRYQSLDKQYDVGVVLGGNMVNLDRSYDRLIFRKNSDRIIQTADLYFRGRLKTILISGGPGDLFQRDKYEAAFLKRYLVSIGIPDSVIMVDSVSDNTHENAVNSAKLINDCCKEGNFLLITSSMHMRRSLACFKKEGIIATPFPTDKNVNKRRTDVEHLFIPQLDSFIYWRMLLHETVGYLVYDWVGYI